MDCYRCKTPIPDTSRFCLSCGAMVSDPTGAGATTAEMDEAASRELEVLVRKEVGAEFDIVRELGRGGMAIVYLATEVHLGRQVAVKVLPPELTFGKGAIERFKREARTAATLDHPNIIPVYRVTPGGKLFWYAMKYLEGRSLADLLDEKKRLALADTVPILESVASALDYAHRRKIVHRDIKPANVMIDLENRVILTDFGIAKELTAGSLTASGSVLGTPFYMSPEQCTGGELTHASDQYSVGIMTYQLLSGQLPFESDSIPDLLHKHCLEPPPPLDVLRPGLPPYVYAAINKALAKKPGERFSGVGAFVQALKRPSAEVTTTEAPRRRSLWHRISTTAVAVDDGRSRRILRIGTGVVLLAGAAGGGLWLLARDSFQRPGSATTTQDSTRLVSPPLAAQPSPDTGARVTDSAAAASGVTGQDSSTSAAPLTPPGRRVTTERTGERPSPTTRRTDAPPAPTLSLPQAPPPASQLGVVVIQTTGGWGRISVDGAFRREGTSHRDTVPPGTHTVHVERPGYASLDTTVNVRAGETQLVRIAMRRGTP